MEPCGDGATRPCETVCGLGATQAQSSTLTTIGHFEVHLTVTQAEATRSKFYLRIVARALFPTQNSYFTAQLFYHLFCDRKLEIVSILKAK